MTSWAPVSYATGIPFPTNGAGNPCEDAVPCNDEDYEKFVSELLTGYDLELEDHREVLPEEIVDIVLRQLPLTAKCRFRCVCQRWRRMLSQPSYCTATIPPCTVLSSFPSRFRDGSRDEHAQFFCDSQWKWCNFPASRYQPSSVTWHVVDVDAGLVCYAGEMGGKLWLQICNPLSCRSPIIISPDDLLARGSLSIERNPPMLKLLVDRVTKSFKVVVLIQSHYRTAVFDSAKASWRLCVSFPQSFGSYPFNAPIEFFVWKGILYAYNVKEERHMRHSICAFDMEIGDWHNVEATFPARLKMHHFILSDGDQVMLVEFSFRKKSYFYVWKPLDIASSHNILFSRWQKIIVGSNHNPGLPEGSRLGSACYGRGYICFMFFHDKMEGHGSKTRAHFYVKYSFASKGWIVMPCPGFSGELCKLHHWEPNLDTRQICRLGMSLSK